MPVTASRDVCAVVSSSCLGLGGLSLDNTKGNRLAVTCPSVSFDQRQQEWEVICYFPHFSISEPSCIDMVGYLSSLFRRSKTVKIVRFPGLVPVVTPSSFFRGKSPFHKRLSSLSIRHSLSRKRRKQTYSASIHLHSSWEREKKN